VEGDYVNTKIIEDEQLDKKEKAEMAMKTATVEKEKEIGDNFM